MEKKKFALGLSLRVTLGALSPIVVVVILGIITYSGINSLRESTRWVEHTHNVIAKANAMLTSAIDMETGLRGFMVTGKEEFLEPYTWGDQHFHALNVELQNTVDDNPPQVELLREIEATIDEWMAEVTEPFIAMRRTVGSEMTMDEIAAIVGEARGKMYFDRFRGQVAEFIEREEVLNDRSPRANC
ncbi:MAG: CHASE3 domain-containing protein [Opitutales bacterium]|nr:CHASE3 domain-containing protein [Opitutales bacterium]NRA28199.1 CHASE3 domain-containing protein [Opitutales bacterium]